MRDGNDFCTRRDMGLEAVHIKAAIRINRGGNGLCAHTPAQKMPGHDIGMVISNRDQHLIPVFQISIAITMRDEVEGHRRPRGKHNF